MNDENRGNPLSIAMLGGGRILCKKIAQLICWTAKMSGRKYKQISYSTKCDMGWRSDNGYEKILMFDTHRWSKKDGDRTDTCSTDHGEDD